MDATIPTTITARTSRGWHPIAAYRSLRGASLALDHLADTGIRPADLGVQPAGLAIDEAGVDRPPDRVPATTSLMVAAAAIALGGVGLLAGAGVALAAAIAVAAALSLWAISSWRLHRRSAHVAEASNTVRAGRFVVVCRDQWRSAGHRLARWWDPEAEPVKLDDAPAAGGRTD